MKRLAALLALGSLGACALSVQPDNVYIELDGRDCIVVSDKMAEEAEVSAGLYCLDETVGSG